MNRLVFSAILLFGWIVFAAINRSLFFNKISAIAQNNIYSDNSPAPTIDRNLGNLNNDSLQHQVRSELYNSISLGMTYEEVSSIVGWKGVLVYESEVNNGGKIMRTKVYQWNYNDLYPNSIFSTDSETGLGNLYKDVTLEFQDNVLIDRSSSNFKP